MKDGVIHVAPIGNLKVLRDLVVDLEPFWSSVGKVKPYLVPDGGQAAPEQGEARRLPRQFLKIDPSTTCILCAACFSDCNALEVDETFLSARPRWPRPTASSSIPAMPAPISACGRSRRRRASGTAPTAASAPRAVPRRRSRSSADRGDPRQGHGRRPPRQRRCAPRPGLPRERRQARGSWTRTTCRFAASGSSTCRACSRSCPVGLRMRCEARPLRSFRTTSTRSTKSRRSSRRFEELRK